MKGVGRTCVLVPLLLLVFHFAPGAESSSFLCGNNTWLEDRACLPWNYNKLKKPDEKVDVGVWFKVTDIMEIDSQGGNRNSSSSSNNNKCPFVQKLAKKPWKYLFLQN